jgi:ABC-2 type transport system ATP-binding protein
MKLTLRGLRKRRGHREVLAGVDLECAPHSVTAITGENGCGKSTLLCTIAGILEADGGTMLLDGTPISSSARRNFGFAADAEQPFPFLTVAEWISLVAALKGVSPPEREAWQRLGVASLAGQRMGLLSLGQRKRANLLAATTGDPWLLILDEPSNGLDRDGVDVLVDLLREHVTRGAVLFASHDTRFIEAVGARRLVLREGVLWP